MPTTTALVLVQRVARRLRKGAVSDFSGDLGAVLLDLVNSAQREVLETAEWDFLTRHDGELVVVPRTEYTGTFTATINSATVTNVGQSNHSTYYGAFRSRLVLTEHTTHGNTSFAITTATHPAADDVYTLETAFPGASGSGLNGTIFVIDYQLPTTVRDVLSVRHEDDDIKVSFADRTETFDRYIPSAHLEDSDSPDLVIVGGSVEATVTTGTPTTKLGLMVWPIPTVAYVLSYSYRYLHPGHSATTDTLDAPDFIADLIVDKACALAYRSAVANDPEMADSLESDIARRFQRHLTHNSPQPQRRRILRSHDQAAGPSLFQHRPANSRVFYEP